MWPEPIPRDVGGRKDDPRLASGVLLRFPMMWLADMMGNVTMLMGLLVMVIATVDYIESCSVGHSQQCDTYQKVMLSYTAQ